MSQNEKTFPLPIIKDSTIVFDGFFKVRRDIFDGNDNKEHSYDCLMTRSSAVIILAETESHELVLTKEYRYPVKQTLLSCPGGYLDQGESIENCAQRELLEETGYTAKTFTLMGTAYPYAGISDQLLYYVAAYGAKQKQQPNLEGAELVSTLLMSYEELWHQIRLGTPIDGNLCTALFYHANS